MAKKTAQQKMEERLNKYKNIASAGLIGGNPTEETSNDDSIEQTVKVEVTEKAEDETAQGTETNVSKESNEKPEVGGTKSDIPSTDEDIKTLEKAEVKKEKASEKSKETKTNKSQDKRGGKMKTTVNSTLDNQKEKLKSRFKKQKVEDTHSRQTYLVRNDLIDELNDLSGGTHGFKIDFINFAIELGIMEWKKMMEEETE